DFSDKTVKFEIRDHNELMTKVIPHFRNYPFFSAKQKDFELFARICLIIDKGQHLTRRGFAEIVELAYRMNGSGKRKRTKEEIINNLTAHQDEDIVLSLSQDKVKKRSSEAHERRNDWGTVSTRSPVKIQYR
ncbi:MAG: LAGLIDADG family homing endonuclease, partial [Candidatus Colwellbacteria bacterium]|nr:LAGLIDADG family homing endonuclease [Candidatus Colwellbacteria bacterium]